MCAMLGEVYVLNNGYEDPGRDLVKVMEPSISDSNLMNDQNQSPLYLGW
jgi:hypothetical protein